MRFLDKYSGRDKRLRALEREVNRLHRAQGDAPIIPLERPYQRGWNKFYVLADRVDERPDVAVFRAMLAQINQRVWSRERSFLNRAGHEIVLRPAIIPVREWLKLAWPASHQRFFGYGCWRLDDQPWTPIKWRRHITGFKLVHAWWLREEIQPHLITHQRVELPEVRSRLAEIHAHMQLTQGWCRLNRLRGRRQWHCNFTPTLNERRAVNSFHDQLAENSPD